VKNTLCIAALCALIPAAVPGLSLWRYPEAADKNTLFIDTAATFSFSSLDSFSLFPLEIRADYLLPVGLPVSAGLFMKTPDPNLKYFGTRLGYHIDIGDQKTDLYFVHVFNLGFIRNDLLEQFNDTPSPLYYYDFRLGVRRLFGSRFCLAVETDFKVFGLVFALSIKLN
jgi:hypothetical protein